MINQIYWYVCFNGRPILGGYITEDTAKKVCEGLRETEPSSRRRYTVVF